MISRSLKGVDLLLNSTKSIIELISTTLGYFKRGYVIMFSLMIALHAYLSWNYFSLPFYNNHCGKFLTQKDFFCFKSLSPEVFSFLPDLLILGLLSLMLMKSTNYLRVKWAPYRERVFFWILLAYLLIRLLALKVSNNPVISYVHDNYFFVAEIAPFFLFGIFTLLLLSNQIKKGESSIPVYSTESKKSKTTSDPAIEAYKANIKANIKSELPRLLTDIAHQNFSRISIKDGVKLSNPISIKNIEFQNENYVFVELSLANEFLTNIESLFNFNWKLAIGSRATIKGIMDVTWKSEEGKNGILFQMEEYSIDFSETLPYPSLLEPNPLLQHAMDVILGVDKKGNTVVVNLAKMPHLLFAGATGKGKSSGMSDVIVSLLKNILAGMPIEKLVLIDPKLVEFAPYDSLHKVNVIIDMPEASEALEEAIVEMEKRYQILRKNKSKNIESYRAKGGNMEYIVIIIDELADMLLGNPEYRDINEKNIARIGQKARACGIHLIVATQRPSVDVVTGLIKANIPSVLGFGTKDGNNSRIIVDSDILAGLPQGEAKLVTSAGVTHLRIFYINDNEGGDIEQFVKYYEEESMKMMHPSIPVYSKNEREATTSPLKLLSEYEKDSIDSPIPVDKFSSTYTVFRYLLTNNGYKNRSELRGIASSSSLTSDQIDEIISVLRNNNITIYDPSKKQNYLAVKPNELSVEFLKSLYEAIYSVTEGK